MRVPPDEVVLGWPTPNYVDPEERGPALYVVAGLCSFLATLAVGLRLYTRVFIRRWFGYDDVCIALSFVRVQSFLLLRFWRVHCMSVWMAPPLTTATHFLQILSFLSRRRHSDSLTSTEANHLPYRYAALDSLPPSCSVMLSSVGISTSTTFPLTPSLVSLCAIPIECLALDTSLQRP